MQKSQLLKWIQAGEITVSRLLLKHYRDIGLNEVNLVTLLQLKSHIDEGDVFPDSNLLAQAMHISDEEAFTQIHELIQKSVLEIKSIKDEDNKTQDIYSLDPLYERLSIYLNQQTKKQFAEVTNDKEAELYQMFEQEFGRPLSPIEIETLTAWVDDDNYSPEMIQMALKQAVLSQVYSLRYIDRILLTWQRKNITTKEQVLKEQEKFRDAKEHSSSSSNGNQSKTEVPLYDWMENLNNN